MKFRSLLRIVDRVLSFRLRLGLLRPDPDRIVVVRVRPIDVDRVRAALRSVGAWPKLSNGSLVLVLPDSVASVAVEPKLKPAEDLGYRETANQRVDADASAESKRAICGATPR